MRIASVQLKNFKRFTDLVIRDIPESAKLVVVVGPNGCGKSSLFDAFIQWYRGAAGFVRRDDPLYFKKDASLAFEWGQSAKLTLHNGAVPKKGSLYVRTAYRNDPDFNISEFSRPNIPSDQVRVEKSIQNDQTVSQNYQRLVYETMAGVYDSGNNAKTVESLREELIGQVRSSMRNVFGDLILNSISDPLGTGAFFFEKGSTDSYHYKNLSGGEKAAFDLILDLHVKKRFFADAVYCIDEVEAHLHTRVQGTLLKELVNILPGDSQLWVTSHSLGVIRAAQEMATIDPSSVCVIDFDGVDPDVPRELSPSSLGRISWEKLLSIALDDLSQRIAPKTLIVCEGSAGTRRKDYDAEIYNRILGSQYPETLFVSGGSSSQVQASGVSAAAMLSKIVPTAKIISLLDRDDRSTGEVQELERGGTLVLPLRSLESYLLADDVIEALVEKEQKQSLLADALQIKSDALAASVSRGNPIDNLKYASGETYTGLKRLLGLQRCGNDSDAFMKDTLAALIVPGMSTYEALKNAIVERIGCP